MKKNQGTTTVPGLLVSTEPAGEADLLVRFFGPSRGGFHARGRGLRKAASKLAPQLQPACELELTLAAGRTLTGVSVHRDHAGWRGDLNLLALYWFFAECAATSSADDEDNAGIYRMLVNLLRTPPEPAGTHGCAAVFCLKLAAINGLLPDLGHCAIDGTAFCGDEPVFLLPGFDGLVGRGAYNRLYARTGGSLARLDPARRQRWRDLAGGALLDYGGAGADLTDSALLVHLTSRGIADMAHRAVRSAEFLKRQWRLPDYAELVRGND